MNFVKSLLLCIFIFPVLFLFAQEKPSYKYVSGEKLTILGRSESISSSAYQRVDSLNRSDLPGKVQLLATYSAGINLLFKTNSKNIRVNWKLKKYNSKANMTPVAVNGLDLYGWNSKSWQFVAAALPESEYNSVSFIKNLDGKMRDYRIYLPLYSELTNIEIGVDSNAILETGDSDFISKKIVAIYGSSITQGASASRPGMAYPSIIARELDVETYNLGFSGSGKMEIEIVEVLSKIPADLYILDCVPNCSPKQIKERAIPFIKKLRKLKPDIPILMVESIFRENGYWNSEFGKRVIQQNAEYYRVYKQLLNEDYKLIYYIPSNELTGYDHEATVDGTHLTDLGQKRIAQRISIVIKQILE